MSSALLRRRAGRVNKVSPQRARFALQVGGPVDKVAAADATGGCARQATHNPAFSVNSLKLIIAQPDSDLGREVPPPALPYIDIIHVHVFQHTYSSPGHDTRITKILTLCSCVSRSEFSMLIGGSKVACSALSSLSKNYRNYLHLVALLPMRNLVVKVFRAQLPLTNILLTLNDVVQLADLTRMEVSVYQYNLQEGERERIENIRRKRVLEYSSDTGFKTFTSSNDISKANMRLTHAMTCICVDREGNNTFCGIMNIPHPVAYCKCLNNILRNGLELVCSESMAEAAKEVTENSKAYSKDLSVPCEG
ncbi:Uncharacterized protein GBIM_17923 [Gryllus bimaculatus]|nr:Uncharacterized protein GBIM_17923 [Gryllus bimaculatus]